MVIQRKVKKTKHGRWRVLGPVIMEDRSWPGRKRMEYACLGFQGDPVGEQYNRWMRAVEKRIRKLKLKVRP